MGNVSVAQKSRHFLEDMTLRYDEERLWSPSGGLKCGNIEIRDAALEARIQKQLQATGSGSVEEVLLRSPETQEEQYRWLSENREIINAKIKRGIEQLDRGEGIPEDQSDVISQI